MSIPRNAKVACTIVDQNARNFPREPSVYLLANAPGSFQYLKPLLSWSGPPPIAKMKEHRIIPKITMTLNDESQNSNSPKIFTPK